MIKRSGQKGHCKHCKKASGYWSSSSVLHSYLSVALSGATEVETFDDSLCLFWCSWGSHEKPLKWNMHRCISICQPAIKFSYYIVWNCRFKNYGHSIFCCYNLHYNFPKLRTHLVPRVLTTSPSGAKCLAEGNNEALSCSWSCAFGRLLSRLLLCPADWGKTLKIFIISSKGPRISFWTTSARFYCKSGNNYNFQLFCLVKHLIPGRQYGKCERSNDGIWLK